MATTLDELRARARSAGIPVGSILRAERLREEGASLAGLRRAARRRGELLDPTPIEVSGCVWRVACCPPSTAFALAADLRELGFRAYAPAGRRIVYRGKCANGKRERRIDAYPVFGNYLFVGEMIETEPLSKFLHRNLSAVLAGPGGPLAVASSAIAAISAAECEGRWDETKRGADRCPYHKGDPVRVKVGPFADFRAIVEAVEHSGRIRIAIDIFGGTTTARVTAAQVEKAA